jgi:hypothetical protein
MNFGFRFHKIETRNPKIEEKETKNIINTINTIKEKHLLQKEKMQQRSVSLTTASKALF